MRKIKVLLADDHTLFREGLHRLLDSEEDIECVAVADDGVEAIRMVKKHQPDVALIDIAMPKMDGIDATKAMKKIRPEIGVLIISAYSNENYVFACMEAGVSGYVLKTANRTDLINAIRVVNGGGSVFGAEIVKILVDKRYGKTRQEVNFGYLNDREVEIVKLTAKGLSNKEIANQLTISDKTVASHLINIFKKLGVQSRVQLIIYALKNSWLTIDDLS